MNFVIVFLSIVISQKSDTDDLIAKLASRKFQERERSQQLLSQKMDLELYNKLKKKRTQDLEQRRRMQELVTEFENKLIAGLRIDLKGYGASPQIDEGMPSTYTYKGMNRWEIICHYLQEARKTRDCWEHYPHYPQYRVAYDIWMGERMEAIYQEAMAQGSAKAIQEVIRTRMEVLHKDTAMLIQGDKDWYGRIGVKNPYYRYDPTKKD